MMSQEERAAAYSQIKPVVVIVGPTAIGKSRIGIHVARAWGTEILTADSTQVYRGMDIGTDKPTAADHAEVPHRLIDLVDPDQPFNAGEFRRYAVQEIQRLHRNGLLPIIVGGTGLYVRVLLRGLWPSPPVDWTLRKKLEAEAAARGMEVMFSELHRVDPESANRLHSHDRVKVLRALEVYRQTGLPLSKAHRLHGLPDHPFQALVLGLTMERSALYRRIEDRVEVELAKGLVDETRRLLTEGYERQSVPMKSLGYRQMAGYLEGEYTYDEAVRRLKRDTRHFAKRQITWFRKEPNLVWIELDPDESPEVGAQRVCLHIDRFMSGLRLSPFPGKPDRSSVAQGQPKSQEVA